MNDRSARSFSISCARHSAILTVALAVALTGALLTLPAATATAKGKKPRDPEALFNPLLGIEHSHWLVGPIAEIATGDEIEAYLALTGDDEAVRFVEEFWGRRAEGYGFFDRKPRQIYEERLTEADKRFSEGTFPGRRTDRGKLWILYGEPEEITFEKDRDERVPTLEVWRYPKDAGAGLDGERPKRVYRFIDVDGSKVLFTGRYRPNPFDRRRLNDGF